MQKLIHKPSENYLLNNTSMCVCVCVCARARACARVRACVCVTTQLLR